MDNAVLSEKLKGLQSLNKEMQANKELIESLGRCSFISNISNGYHSYDLTEEQRRTVNHLIASFLQQNVDEMEQKLKPLADLLDTQK